MNIELTKEQQLQLIKANKFFKLKMLKDNFTEEQADLYEYSLCDLFPFVLRVSQPNTDDMNGLYKWVVGA